MLNGTYTCKTSESGMELPNVLMVFFFQISIETPVAPVVNSHPQPWIYSSSDFILTKLGKYIYWIVLRTSGGDIPGFQRNFIHPLNGSEEINYKHF